VHVTVRTVYPDDYAISDDCKAGRHISCDEVAPDVEYPNTPTSCECDCHQDDDDLEPTGGVR
jgi:hypothetical protein